MTAAVRRGGGRDERRCMHRVCRSCPAFVRCAEACSESHLRPTKTRHEQLMMPINHHHVHHCCVATRPMWLQQNMPQAATDLPESLRCRYMSKRCEKPRTVKKSGDLHRFCAFHRERANRNQRRVDQRRRLLKKKGVSKLKSESWSDDEDKQPSPRKHEPCVMFEDDFPVVRKTEYATSCHHEATLNDQDITILNALLFDDDAHAAAAAHRRVILPVAHVCDRSLYAPAVAPATRRRDADATSSRPPSPVESLYVL